MTTRAKCQLLLLCFHFHSMIICPSRVRTFVFLLFCGSLAFGRIICLCNFILLTFSLSAGDIRNMSCFRQTVIKHKSRATEPSHYRQLSKWLHTQDHILGIMREENRNMKLRVLSGLRRGGEVKWSHKLFKTNSLCRFTKSIENFIRGLKIIALAPPMRLNAQSKILFIYAQEVSISGFGWIKVRKKKMGCLAG